MWFWSWSWIFQWMNYWQADDDGWKKLHVTNGLAKGPPNVNSKPLDGIDGWDNENNGQTNYLMGNKIIKAFWCLVCLRIFSSL